MPLEPFRNAPAGQLCFIFARHASPKALDSAEVLKASDRRSWVRRKDLGSEAWESVRRRKAIRPSEWSKALTTADQVGRSASAPMDPGPTERALRSEPPSRSITGEACRSTSRAARLNAARSQ